MQQYVIFTKLTKSTAESDLCLSGDTLIIPGWHDNSVRCCEQLRFPVCVITIRSCLSAISNRKQNVHRLSDACLIASNINADNIILE